MISTLLLIELLGAAALLLWGLQLLKSGVNTALGRSCGTSSLPIVATALLPSERGL